MTLHAYPLISDWVRAGDGRLILRTGKVDIGQRISSALAQIAHEELTLPHDRIDMAPVRTGDSPDEGMTSGSNSVEQSGHALRLAAATLAGHLRIWAAEQAGGTPEDWRLTDGLLTRPGANRPIPLLDLLAGRDLALPIDNDAQLAPGGGQPAPMRGMQALVTGRYRFVHDIVLPEMLHARPVHPPHLRARLRGIPARTLARLAEAGIEVIRDGSFLAVAGPREWPVVQAAERLALACDWDRGTGLPETDLAAALTPANAQRLPVRDGTPVPGPIPAPLDTPSHSARYSRPFTMHGALAPSAALAQWDGTTLRVTTHSQGIYPLRDAIAESMGLPPEAVELTHAPGSGCYGHNGADDAAYEAALIARALPGRPILLKWSRTDEHTCEPYGPPMAVELVAQVTEGRLTALSAEAIGGTFRGRPRAGPDRAGPAKLMANWLRDTPEGPQEPRPNMGHQGGLHRNLTPIYDIPELRLVKNLVTDLPLRSSALRCLGAAANVFALESIMDEIARDLGAEPLDFRRRHLSDPRALAVLDHFEAALPPVPEGCGRGIAFAQYKNLMTRVAVAVDLAVDDRAEVQMHRALIVADAGRVIDRDGLIAQLEGGFVQAASWALREAVTWDRDGVTSCDWDSYPVLRFDAMPEVEVQLIDQPGAPARGAGEASSGPTLAAIANAIFDLTDLRMRHLPMTAEAITAEALR